MDVNGTKFQLLLGRDDWKSCALEDVEWADRGELTLHPEAFRFPPARLDRPPRVEDRRGAGRDRFGNWYWIAADARTVLVESSGTGATTVFWPGHEDCPPEPARLGVFGPREPAPPPPRPPVLSGAAVTEDHYLVVGTFEPPGLLVFDLQTGGPPSQLPWPDPELRPFDMAPRPGGGIFVLDRDNGRAWELDRHFHVLAPLSSPPASPAAGAFTALAGEPDAGPAPPLPPVEPITLGAADPISIEAAPGGGFLVLDRAEAAGRSVVTLYRDGLEAGAAATGDVVGQDMALVGDTLFVVDGAGNQSYAFELTLGPSGPVLQAELAYYPMRLYGGKGLVAAGGQAWYDFGDGWIPLVRQSRPRYVESGTVVTPTFDGGRPGCVWHRLMLDACLPPGTGLAVWSAAADEQAELDVTEWSLEPSPLPRRGGAEVPFVDLGRYATHELLFQHAKGRFLRLKVELAGDGRASPRLRALRAWYPRFSYRDHYLAGVYREDPVSASFLDRFLANVEGLYTAIEDRIAAAQVLLGPATVPADALEWLAGWFELALDPLWDERRRRLFLANAMRFFRLRGTMRGIEVALRFVLDHCVEADVFDEPRPPALATARIVEAYRTRKTPGVVFGDPTDLELPRRVTTTARWSPAQGRDALNAGWASHLGVEAADFPVADPADATTGAWREFSQAALGFVPAPIDPGRWRSFLSRRYANPGALAAAYGLASTPPEWKSVEPPSALPPDGPALVDWFQFESVVVPVERKAHRFTVLLPWPLHILDSSGNELDEVQLRDLARRVVELQKPAHTVFNVKFFWAAFRIGEARLGDDTLLASGSRVPELVQPAVLGRDYLGETRLGGLVASDTVRHATREETP